MSPKPTPTSQEKMNAHVVSLGLNRKILPVISRITGIWEKGSQTNCASQKCMFRECTNKEKNIFKQERKGRAEEALKEEIKEEVKEEVEEEVKKVKSSEPLIDYKYWDDTDTTEEESWSSIANKCRNAAEKNQRLKRVDELTKISDVLAAEMLEPAYGLTTAAVLSGFDAAWTEAQE